MNITFRRRVAALSDHAIDASTFALAVVVGVYIAQFEKAAFLSSVRATELGLVDVLAITAGLFASTRFGSMPIGLRRLETSLAHLWIAARQAAVATATITLPSIVFGSPLLSSQGFVLGFASTLIVLRFVGRIAHQDVMVWCRRGRAAHLAGRRLGTQAARLVRDTLIPVRLPRLRLRRRPCIIP